MSKRTRTILKSWFETGDIPTQEQFADWIDSYWHLDDGSVITGFEDLGNGDVRITLSDGQSFTIVATPNSTPPKVLIIDKWLVWKTTDDPNPDPSKIQNNDKIQGQFDADRFGTYRVLDATDLTIRANLTSISEHNNAE